MPQFIRAKNLDTGHECLVAERDPTTAAVAFDELTGQIWSNRPENWSLSFFEAPAASGIDLEYGRDLINSALLDIDEELVIANSGKPLLMTSMHGEQIEISPSSLKVPEDIGIQVFNWDHSPAYRRIDVGSARQTLQLIDRESEYTRELWVAMRFRLPDDMIQIKYGFDRQQKYQGTTTDMTVAASLGQFVETGYEDGEHIVEGMEISDAQELKLIQAIAQIGGFVLKKHSLAGDK